MAQLGHVVHGHHLLPVIFHIGYRRIYRAALGQLELLLRAFALAGGISQLLYFRVYGRTLHVAVVEQELIGHHLIFRVHRPVHDIIDHGVYRVGHGNYTLILHLRQLLEYFFVKDEAFISSFKGHSAAKTVHHSFSGGLLEHTLSVVHLCEYFAGAYSILNRDLLISAALCHDIGKTRELSAFPDNDYTDEGQLIGHIVIGVEMIDEALREQPDFPVKLANELKHCVVAHHGELEYGSPKKPALAEALALNLADNADAKLQTLTEIFKGKTGTEWLGFNRLFESNLRRTSGT